MKKEHKHEEQVEPTQAQVESNDTTATEATEATINFEEKYNTINDTYLRLLAEFDNYKKRTLREKSDLIKHAGEKVIVNILPVVDNFERALATMETATDVQSIQEGVKLIYQQLMSVLTESGVKSIETTGQVFDMDLHEAITTIPVEEETKKGTIIDCVQSGYTLNEKVIRYPKVIVGE